MNNRPSAHVLQLDGLRTVAIGMVLVAHWVQWKFDNPFLKNFPFAHGVTLFFVLSGFLITGILLDGRKHIEASSSTSTSFLGAFYARRSLRIFPVYYLLIGLLFLMDFEEARHLFPWLVTYTTNIYQSIHGTYIGSFNHFWSLAAEEQFYLLWPVILLWIPVKRIPLAIFSMIGVSILFRCWVYVFTKNWMAMGYSTPGCMYALGIGAAGAFLTREKVSTASILRSTKAVTIAVILYLSLYISFDTWGPYWYKDLLDEVVFACMCLPLVLSASTNGIGGGVGKILSSRFFVYTGRISYGIYLFHLFIPSLVYWVIGKIGLNMEGGPLVFLVFTWCAAALSWKFLEAPMNNLKRYFPYEGRKKAVSGG